MSDITRRDLSRRDLLKGAALAGAALATSGAFHPAIAENVDAIAHPDLAPPAPARRQTMRAVPFERHETVRIGIVGTGLRGRSVLSELLAIDGVKITALCDNVPAKATDGRQDGDGRRAARARDCTPTAITRSRSSCSATTSTSSTRRRRGNGTCR